MATTKSVDIPKDWENDFNGFVSGTFDAIVKPEKRESWHAKKKNFFVLDQSIESMRKPGKLTENCSIY